MKKRHIITALAGIGLALNLASWAHADDASAAQAGSDSANQSLDERVSALEQRLALLSPVTGTSTAFQGSPASAFASVDRGIGFVSGDGNYGIKFGATLQEDTRSYLDGGLNSKSGLTSVPVSEFVLARARLLVDAFLGPRVHLRYQEDFSNNGTNSGSANVPAATNGGLGAELVDAYGELRLAPWTLLRVGQYRPGLDIERWRQTPAADWIQFGYTAGLVVDRTQGAQIEIADPKQLFYLNGGVFNGATDTGNPVVASPANSDKDAIARLFIQPFNDLSDNGLGDLGLGVAASGGNHTGDAAPTYKTLGQESLVAVSLAGASAKTDYAEGAGYRVAPQAYWFLDQFSLLSEYVHESQGYEAVPTHEDETVSESWQVQAGWVITGEHASYNGLKLDKNSYSWGALQLVARVEGADYLEGAFSGPYAIANPESAPESLTSWSVGLNYVPVNDVKFLLDWDETSFVDGGANTVAGKTVLADRAPENVLQGRVQFAF